MNFKDLTVCEFKDKTDNKLSRLIDSISGYEIELTSRCNLLNNVKFIKPLISFLIRIFIGEHSEIKDSTIGIFVFFTTSFPVYYYGREES